MSATSDRLTSVRLLASTGQSGFCELVKDSKFSDGLTILDTELDPSSKPRILGRLGGKVGTEPAWQLGQWWSQRSIQASDGGQLSDGSYVWQNQFKTIHLNPGSFLDLGSNGIEEYNRAVAKSNAHWPHLLIEQAITNPYSPLASRTSPSIARMDHIWLDLRTQLLRFELGLPGADPQTNASLIPLFIGIQNLNPANAGSTGPGSFGQLIQVNIPVFDNRVLLPPPAEMYDPGTLSNLYSTGYAYWSSTPMSSGQEIRFQGDILPFVKKALEKAFSANSLTSKTVSDYYVSGISIGWENSLNADVSFRIHHLSLRAVSEDCK